MRQNAGVKRSVPQYLDAWNTQPWLRRGGHAKAQSISDIEWLTLVEDPDTEQMTPVEDLLEHKHPLQEFFDHPHPIFSWQAITYIWSAHLDLCGEAWGVWDIEGDTKQIWPIPPDKITELPQYPAKPYYTLSLSNGQHHIPPELVFWMCEPNPAQPYGRGSGLAQTLNDELSIYSETGKTIDTFFRKQARPDVLITGKSLNPEKTKRLESEWKEKLSGFWNQYKPFFLNDEVTVQTFKQDFEGAQFLDLTKMERNTIVQVLGLPPEIAGINENSNRAMIEAADLFFSKWTLQPRLNMLRENFQKQIVPMFDDTGFVELDYVSPVAEDKEFEASVIRFASWAFLIDEIRVKAGEEPLPDGRGQSLGLPMNLTITPLTSLPAVGLEVPEPSGTTTPGTPEPILIPGEGEITPNINDNDTDGGNDQPSPTTPPVDSEQAAMMRGYKAWRQRPTTRMWLKNKNSTEVVRTGKGYLVRLPVARKRKVMQR